MSSPNPAEAVGGAPNPPKSSAGTRASGAGEAGSSAGEAAGGNAGSLPPAPECPQGDWQELDGTPCDQRAAPSNCVKIGLCASPADNYRDERLYCFSTIEPGHAPFEWAVVFDEGSCDTSSIELDADGCPTSDWSEADSLPCTEEGLECADEGPYCPNDLGYYYDEYVSCYQQRWSWNFDEGPCCDFAEGGAGSDCG